MTTADPSEQKRAPLGTVLVTGGCGFLGSHIVALILERYSSPATSVSVLDLRTDKNQHVGAEYFQGDLTDVAEVRNVLSTVKPNIIIHTASPVFKSGGGEKARNFMRKVNVEGTRVLMEQAKSMGCNCFVYTSSASVASDTRTDLINADESWSVVRGKAQREYYSDTKAEAEQLVLSYSTRSPSTSPFLTCALRPSAMFGEQDVQMIPNMLNVLRDGRTKFQLGENDNLFDFTYVGNVAFAHTLAAARLRTLANGLRNGTATGEEVEEENALKADGEAFIITNHSPVYFWDFARAVWQAYFELSSKNPTASSTSTSSQQSLLHPSPPAARTATFKLSSGVAVMIATVLSFFSLMFRLAPPKLQPAQVRYACMTRYFRVTKAERRLAYEPLWDLDEGIQRTVKYFWEKEKAAS